MCLLIRYLIRKARIKEYFDTKETGFLPMSQIRSAVILLDGTSEGCTSAGEKLKKFFSSCNVSVTLMYLDFRRKSKTVIRYSPAEETIYSRHISWTGVPKIKKFHSLLTTEFDLMINLVENSGFTVDFLSKSLKARFKIGALDYKGHDFDFIIETPSPDGTQPNNSDSRHGTATSDKTEKKIEIIIEFLKKII